MFIEKGHVVTAVDEKGNTFTGEIYAITIQNCKDDENRPHALVFISQDKRFIEKEGDFGCVSLWVDKLRSLSIL